MNVTATERRGIIIDSIAVLIGDYRIEQKIAANILLKIFLPNDFRKFLFEDKNIYPYKRSDARVREWVKKVTATGECEMCGSSDHLEAHHIIKWSDYPAGRIDEQNGQCLCAECHANIHSGDPFFAMMKAKQARLCSQ